MERAGRSQILALQQLYDAEREIKTMRCGWPDENRPPSRVLYPGGAAAAAEEEKIWGDAGTGSGPDQGGTKNRMRKRRPRLCAGNHGKITSAQVCDDPFSRYYTQG